MTHPTSSPASPPVAASSADTVSAPVVEPALVEGVDVDAVARAVRACAGVADLYSGRFGEIGSYLPGRRVGGVQVDDTSVTVHIRARWGYGVKDLLAQANAVTVALRNGRRLDLVVDDIDDDVTGPAGSFTNAITAVAPPRAIAPPAAPIAPASVTPPAAGRATSALPESSTS